MRYGVHTWCKAFVSMLVGADRLNANIARYRNTKDVRVNVGFNKACGQLFFHRPALGDVENTVAAVGGSIDSRFDDVPEAAVIKA